MCVWAQLEKLWYYIMINLLVVFQVLHTLTSLLGTLGHKGFDSIIEIELDFLNNCVLLVIQLWNLLMMCNKVHYFLAIYIETDIWLQCRDRIGKTWPIYTTYYYLHVSCSQLSRVSEYNKRKKNNVVAFWDSNCRVSDLTQVLCVCVNCCCYISRIIV